MDSWIEELERLGQLRRDGVLSDEEFETLKSRLLPISGEELGTETVSPESGSEENDAIRDEDDQEDQAAVVDLEVEELDEVEQPEETVEPGSENDTKAVGGEPPTTSDSESNEKPETEPEAEPEEEPARQPRPTPSVEVVPPASVHPGSAINQSTGGSKKVLVLVGVVAVAAVVGLLVGLAGNGDGPTSTELASLEQRIESLEIELAPTTTRAPATTRATTTTRTPATTRATTTTRAKARVNVAQCREEMAWLYLILDTPDNDLFDRVFRRTLTECGDVKTWRREAGAYGGSITGMLSAACMLNGSTPVCRDR